jgi:hypothetical protein
LSLSSIQDLIVGYLDMYPSSLLHRQLSCNVTAL